MLASAADCSKFHKLEERGQLRSPLRQTAERCGITGVLRSHGRRDLVLEGVGWDPVGSFQKNGFSIDAEIKAQSRRPDNRVLDEFHCAKIHLQEEIFHNTDIFRLLLF